MFVWLLCVSAVGALLSGSLSLYLRESRLIRSAHRKFVHTHLMQLLGTKCICTTSYHLIANGLVEHLHHQLKASLKDQPDPTNWTDSLHMVLPGICNDVKEDSHYTAAELLYGITLCLPSQFFIRTVPQVYHAAS